MQLKKKKITYVSLIPYNTSKIGFLKLGYSLLCYSFTSKHAVNVWQNRTLYVIVSSISGTLDHFTPLNALNES